MMKKSAYVPAGIVSSDPEIEKMREMLTSGEELVIDRDGTISWAEKAGTPIHRNSNGSGTEIVKAKTVPRAIVSAGQWYESNPRLLEAEKEAMYDYQGKRAKFGYLKDGRACWLVHCQPSIAGKPRSKCREYDIALIYDKDHPRVRYGSSVKAYLLRPTIKDLQKIVNKTPKVSPKRIPHLLEDENGELYLCSADTSNVSASLDSRQGITSASTSLRFALRWINVFELGLIDPVTWEMFQEHGEI